MEALGRTDSRYQPHSSTDRLVARSVDRYGYTSKKTLSVRRATAGRPARKLRGYGNIPRGPLITNEKFGAILSLHFFGRVTCSRGPFRLARDRGPLRGYTARAPSPAPREAP